MSLYGLKSVAKVTLFDLESKQPVLYADYANASSQEWSSERTYAMAGGARAIAWDSNREGTLTMEFEVFDLSWLALLAGTDVKEGSAAVARREVFILDAAEAQSGALTLSRTPQAASVTVVPVDPANRATHVGAPLNSVSGSPSGGEFSVEGDTILLSDAVEGQAFAVNYLSEVNSARKIVIEAEKFPGAVSIVGTAKIRNRQTGRDEIMKLTFYNARPQSNFEVTMSASDVTTITATFDLFPESGTDRMAEYVVLKDEDESGN